MGVIKMTNFLIGQILTVLYILVSTTNAYADGAPNPTVMASEMRSTTNTIMSIGFMGGAANTTVNSIQNGTVMGTTIETDGKTIMSIGFMGGAACTQVGVIGVSDDCTGLTQALSDGATNLMKAAK
jgi:hypothetical protein